MKRSVALYAAMISLTTSLVEAETLYNGIELPAEWPPRVAELTREPLAPPPYLLKPPAVIPIDVGRQLFVDDFLIESTTLTRVHHRPDYHSDNPILTPDQPWETRNRRVRAAMFSDGVWFDPKDRLFKMWYWASSYSETPVGYDTCLAISKDGIRWEKPKFDVVPDTNIVLRDEPGWFRNSSTVWLDHAEKDPSRRFKMFRVVLRQTMENGHRSTERRIRISFSPDGIHWKNQMDSDECGDRSTVFFNPFRNVWIFGLRDFGKQVGRCRTYYEFADPLPATSWKAANGKRGKLWWIGADQLDPDRSDLKLNRDPKRPWDLVPSQLYNLDCVAYESVLLGLFSIWRGDPMDRPKINEVCVGYSRDGFHWSRPDRKAFCPVSEAKTDWNWGNVQSAGGCCLVVGDKLYFYVGGVTGRDRFTHPDPSEVGLAILRRDGFVSMDAEGKAGSLTTRPVKFSGKHLFVNLAVPNGELRAEILDGDGKVIATSESVRGDNTRLPIPWKGMDDLGSLSGKPVRFRFHLQRGSFYSFWVNPDKEGASRGYVAAGGPGFSGAVDVSLP